MSVKRIVLAIALLLALQGCRLFLPAILAPLMLDDGAGDVDAGR